MRHRLLVAIALVALGILAFWTRRQFVDMYGGRAPSYVEWATAHYFGGLSEFYINAAAAWRRGEQYTDLVYPPGYVALLAAETRVAGGDLRGARIVQGAFDSVTVVAIYLLAGIVGLSPPFAL